MRFEVPVKRVECSIRDDFYLVFSAQDCFSCYTSRLMIGQRDADVRQRDPVLRQMGLEVRKRVWTVRFKPNPDSYVIQASDGGPKFSSPQLKELVVSTRNQSSLTQLRVEVVREPDGQDNLAQNWFFVTDHNDVVLSFILATNRRVTRGQWNLLRRKKEPEPKSSLLDSSKVTGDVILVGGVSTS